MEIGYQKLKNFILHCSIHALVRPSITALYNTALTIFFPSFSQTTYCLYRSLTYHFGRLILPLFSFFKRRLRLCMEAAAMLTARHIRASIFYDLFLLL